MVGCKIGANAIRLHDKVVAVVAKVFRSLCVDAIDEPMRLYADVAEDRNNQRPDIFLRNPRGLGRQIILDVAVTGIDGQPEQVMRPWSVPCRFGLRRRWLTKYGRVASKV